MSPITSPSGQEQQRICNRLLDHRMFARRVFECVIKRVATAGLRQPGK